MEESTHVSLLSKRTDMPKNKFNFKKFNLGRSYYYKLHYYSRHTCAWF
jgi:hypothetical protein